jgi:meiotically up-regulated gene 157 (Mug157) protein
MTTRRAFLASTAALGFQATRLSADTRFTSQRPPLAQRKFTSPAVENRIEEIKRTIGDQELGWMFENCFPNTLDTTVRTGELDGKPDTFVITGDIDAMWLRDSTAQVWPYLPLVKQDPKLQRMLAGAINRQTRCVLTDPYANAFNYGPTGSPWAKDLTLMKPELHDHGYGNPARPCGLIHSGFRPSDDACIFPFLIPSNFFAVTALRQLQEIHGTELKNPAFARQCGDFAAEVQDALARYGKATHPQRGEIYAFEVDGYGSALLMDDAGMPGLLAMPYLGSVAATDPVYRNTRAFSLSEDNPFFYRGTAAEGLGSPHAGLGMIWPLGIIGRALTSNDEKEIAGCLATLKATHAGTGFMHEAFDRNDASRFTRKWFAWANTLFGELILTVAAKYPQLLRG